MFEWGSLSVVIGCFVGLAGWLAGRDKKIAQDSEWRGTVNAQLSTIIAQSSCIPAMQQKLAAIEPKLTYLEQSVRNLNEQKKET